MVGHMRRGHACLYQSCFGFLARAMREGNECEGLKLTMKGEAWGCVTKDAPYRCIDEEIFTLWIWASESCRQNERCGVTCPSRSGFRLAVIHTCIYELPSCHTNEAIWAPNHSRRWLWIGCASSGGNPMRSRGVLCEKLSLCQALEIKLYNWIIRVWRCWKCHGMVAVVAVQCSTAFLTTHAEYIFHICEYN
jgi:hypothetical protein